MGVNLSALSRRGKEVIGGSKRVCQGLIGEGARLGERFLEYRDARKGLNLGIGRIKGWKLNFSFIESDFKKKI